MDDLSTAATSPYAAAAAAPPTAIVLTAPQTYPQKFLAAPVIRALTAPKIRRIIPVIMQEISSPSSADDVKKYGRSGIIPPTR